MKRAAVLVAALCAGVLCLPTTASAHEDGLTPTEIRALADGLQPPPPGSALEGVAEASGYGTDDFSWVMISASQCAPAETSYTISQNYAWYYGTSGSPTHWNCHISIPTGRLLTSVQIETIDADATDDIHALLWRMDLFATTFTQLGSGSTSGTGQTSITISGLSETIANHFHYYNLRIYTESGTPTNQFRGIWLRTWRQISPAPASATFNDVSTGHPFFQHIEALADSGITAGCGGGNYCPDDSLTRGQMAVFLSKALGLHWSEPGTP